MNLEILSTGMYFPEHVRTNDYWPESVVNSWATRMAHPSRQANDALSADEDTPGAAAALNAMKAMQRDLFQGVRQRHVIDDAMESSDIEVLAANDALARAQLDKSQIDLVITQTMVPDFQVVNSASILHHKLGLSPSCMTFGLESVCTSFPMQMQVAGSLMAAGTARYALLVQSSAVTRILDYEHPVSPWLGDGAVAQVVALTGNARSGLLAQRFHTDGSMHQAFVAGVPGKRWYEGDPVIAYAADSRQSRRMMLRGPDLARELVHGALADAGLGIEEVAFFAGHQAVGWLAPTVQQFVGLAHARTSFTQPYTGSLSSANLGAQLAIAEREGTLRPGDLVATFTYASGMTGAGTVLRWHA